MKTKRVWGFTFAYLLCIRRCLEGFPFVKLFQTTLWSQYWGTEMLDMENWPNVMQQERGWEEREGERKKKWMRIKGGEKWEWKIFLFCLPVIFPPKKFGTMILHSKNEPLGRWHSEDEDRKYLGRYPTRQSWRLQQLIATWLSPLSSCTPALPPGSWEQRQEHLRHPHRGPGEGRSCQHSI